MIALVRKCPTGASLVIRNSGSAVGSRRQVAAARAADRLLDREAATREVSLATLQVWQAITERVSGRPANQK